MDSEAMASTPATTHAINLRKVPDDLYWKLKMRAAESRQGLEAYVLSVLERAASKATETKR